MFGHIYRLSTDCNKIIIINFLGVLDACLKEVVVPGAGCCVFQIFFLPFFNLFCSKNPPKKDKLEVPPQGVDQLLHVYQLSGVDKNTFFCSISDFFSDFSCEITEKALNWTQKVEKLQACTQKLVEIHNSRGWETNGFSLSFFFGNLTNCQLILLF